MNDLLFLLGQPPPALPAEFEDLVENIFVPQIIAEPVRSKDEDVVCENRKAECVWLYG
jgi:hypothetical protein